MRLAALIGLITQIALAGITEMAPAQASDPAIRVIDDGSAGGSVQLPLGRELEVSLGANPSTGYTWRLDAGDTPGLRLKSRRFQPGTTTPHTDFDAQVYILSKDEGGRHTPFFNNYRPQFYFRTTDVTGVVTLPEGTEMVMPGDNTEMKVELIQPIAMEEGLRFAIREGGRTVGAGRVIKIIK